MNCAKDILNAYPTCKTAVAYTELLICGKPSDGSESCWDLMMGAIPPLTLDEALKCIRIAMETEEPAYRVYLAGKIGMV